MRWCYFLALGKTRRRRVASAAWIPALLAVWLMGGCLANTMKSWEGHHRDDLVKKWGPPARETKLTDGGVSMVYTGNVTYQASQFIGEASVCKMVFNTDKDLVIRSWAYYGC